MGGWSEGRKEREEKVERGKRGGEERRKGDTHTTLVLGLGRFSLRGWGVGGQGGHDGDGGGGGG